MESATQIELDGQYRALRDGAGMLEREHARVLAVGGADAPEYLQGQLTNEVEGLAAGEGCYAALLDRKGHLQGDMRVLRTSEGFLIDTEPLAADAVLRHLTMYKIGREVSVEDASGKWAIVSLIGPASTEIAVGGPLGREHAHRQAELGGIRCHAVVTEVGVDLFARPGETAAIRSAALDAGAEPVSEAAAEILRVERGRPRFGREMSSATMPAEAGLDERAVSFTKGCYIGQEPVARLHYKGKPNRRLRGLRLTAPASPGEPIRLGDRELGRIGTAVLSPAHGAIALAIVRREAGPGAAVTVGEDVEAEVVELPFS